MQNKAVILSATNWNYCAAHIRISLRNLKNGHIEKNRNLYYPTVEGENSEMGNMLKLCRKQAKSWYYTSFYGHRVMSHTGIICGPLLIITREIYFLIPGAIRGRFPFPLYSFKSSFIFHSLYTKASINWPALGDDISKYFSKNEKICVLIQFSPKFVGVQLTTSRH